MAIGQVTICNRALQKVGASLIRAIDENSPSAKACNAMWESLRRAELRAHFWSFAIKRKELAALSEAPLFGKAYQYSKPSDFLRIAQPDQCDNDFFRDYQIEGSVIVSDRSGSLQLRYVADITDTTLFDSMFVEALACKMAIELCEPITQSNTKKQTLLAEYRYAIAEARRTNAIERRPQEVPDDPWVTARL